MPAKAAPLALGKPTGKPPAKSTSSGNDTLSFRDS
jgi:hypothetical protein